MSQPYPSYKDSGTDWLGKVPSHWVPTPLRHVAKFINGAAFKPVDWSDQGTAIIRIENLNGGEDFNYYDGEVDSRYIVQEGDILFGWSGNRGTSFGPFIWKRPGRYFLNQQIFNVQGYSCDRAWFYWCLRAVTEHVEEQAHGIIGMVHITKGNLGAIRVPIPPISEQHAIAAFLDRETGKIDALVEEQRRLNALLKEKRQAVISHAVTKGLDPTAPLKPSGIDWLGDIPAHWDLGRLKHDLVFLTSGSRGWAAHYADDGALFIRIGNLTRETLDLNLADVQRVDVPDGTEGQRTRVRGGDLLFSITAYLGSVAVVPDDLETAYVSQHVALARLRQRRFRPKWAGHVTLSVVGRTYLDEQGYGGTKIQLALDDVANLLMPIPPLKEQDRILRYIAMETSKIDILISEAETAIALLQERRSALISAAVTGKIDVRALVPDTTEAA